MIAETQRELEARKRRRGRRLRIVGLIVAILAAGVAVNAYLAFDPDHVARRVEAELASLFGDRLRIEGDIEVDWVRGVELRDVVLSSAGGREALGRLRVRSVVVVPRRSSLLFGRVALDEVTLQEPLLHVNRGGEDLDELVTVLLSDDDASAPRKRWRRSGLAGVTVKVRRGQIHYRDERRGVSAVRLDLLGLEASLRHDEAGVLTGSGTARSPFAEHWSFELRVAERAELKFAASRVDLASPLVGEVMPPLGALSRRGDLLGLLDVKGQLGFDAADGLRVASIGGRVLDGYLRLPGFPFPLEQLEGEFQLAGERLHVGELSGRLCSGAVRASGTVDWSAGFERIDGYRLKLDAESLTVDPRLGRCLSADLEPVYDRLRPRGRVSVRGVIAGDSWPPQPGDADLKLELDAVEVVDRELAYPVSGVSGVVTVRQGRLESAGTLSARMGSAPLEVTGFVDLASAAGAVRVDALVKNLPLDDRLRNALPVSLAAQWRQFDPTGEVDARLSIRSSPPADAETGAARIELTLVPRGISVRHARLPLKITDITGEARLDFSTGRLELVELRGEHDGQVLTADGEVSLRGEPTGSVAVSFDTIALDEELRLSLPASLARAVADLGLSGRVGGQVLFHVGPRGPVSAEARLEVQDLSVSFVHFPYPFRFRRGRVLLERDGELVFGDVATTSESVGAQERVFAVLSGSLQTLGRQRTFRYDGHVENLPVDDELLRHLPAQFRRLARALAVNGSFAGRLEGRIVYDVDDPSRSHVWYRASDLSTSGLALDFGPVIDQVRGRGEFEGRRGLDGRHRFRGSARIDASRFNRITFRGVDLDFDFGDEPSSLRQASGAAAEESQLLSLDTDFESERAAATQAETLYVRAASSDLYGGELQGWLLVDTGLRSSFAGRFAGRNVDVARAAPDIFGVESSDLEGKTRGAVTFAGPIRQLDTLRGAGELRVREAKLTDLPIFVGFLRRLFTGNLGDAPHFRELEIDFTIEDGRFVAPNRESITLRADGLQLTGAGSMTYDGELEAVFRPHMSDVRIPILDNIFDLVKKALVEFDLRGTIEEPRFRLLTAGGILRLPLGGAEK